MTDTKSDTKDLISETESALSTASLAATSTIVKAEKAVRPPSGWQNALEAILGGKKRMWVEKDVDGNRLGKNMLGWMVFGAAVHGWHRGIQGRRIFSAPLRPYFVALPIWAVLGYYVHHFELRQEEVIAQRRLILHRNRGLLSDKDIDEIEIATKYQENHEKRAKLLEGLRDGSIQLTKPSPNQPKKDEHPMVAKVKALASQTNEMESYGKKLNETLEQFEREFEQQGKSSSPVVSSSRDWVRHTYRTPEEAKAAYEHGAFPSTSPSPSKSSSSGFLKSIFGAANRPKKQDEKEEQDRFNRLPEEVKRELGEWKGPSPWGPDGGRGLEDLIRNQKKEEEK